MKLKDFGLRNGINEVIGITEGEWLNTAPLGIIVEDENSCSARVRLYSSHTRDNIERGCDLWVNVIFDPIVFVISAFEDLSEDFFESLRPPVIKNSYSWLKFTAKISGNFAELELIDGEVVGEARAVNRGFNSVIEALVHATRYAVSPAEELKNKILQQRKMVERCGGVDEKKAYDLILNYINLR